MLPTKVKLSEKQKDFVAGEFKKHLARQHLLDFTLYTTADWIVPYEVGWVHKVLCSELELFFEKVKRKAAPRLLIVMPPQHGKSELVSRRFPAWVLGRDPDLNIITTSYSADRAGFNSLDVQGIIESEAYAELWPDRKLALHRADTWNLIGHERFYFRAAGIEGGITGLGAHILIWDDLLKNWEEANSTNRLDKIWMELGASAKSRLSEGAGILGITTRWNVRDPAGRYLDLSEAGGFKWKYLWYPQLAIESGPHREAIGDFRKVGETLCPELFSQEYSEDVRNDYYKAKQGNIWETANQGIPQETIGACYFKRPADDPVDKAMRWFEAQTVQPRICTLQIIQSKKQHRFVDDPAGCWRVWEDPIPGFCYGFGVDVSEGINRGDGVTDEHAIEIWRWGILSEVIDHLHISPKVSVGEVQLPCVVATYTSRAALPDFSLEVLESLFFYNHARVDPERNDPGIALIDMCLAIQYPFELIYREETHANLVDMSGTKFGSRVTSANKPTMLNGLAMRIWNHEYTNPESEFWPQARHFVNMDGKLGGEFGWHDDRVMAAAHADQLRRRFDLFWPGNLKKAVKIETIDEDDYVYSEKIG